MAAANEPEPRASGTPTTVDELGREVAVSLALFALVALVAALIVAVAAGITWLLG